MAAPSLHWLPVHDTWSDEVGDLADSGVAPTWSRLQQWANVRLDFLQTNRLDGMLRQACPAPPAEPGTVPARIALLGSATMEHLAAGIRVALLRRNIWADVYAPPFGQQQQTLLDPGALSAFAPTHILFAYDAAHLAAGLDPAADAAQARAYRHATIERIRGQWHLARRVGGAKVLHQTTLPTAVPSLGSNEHRLPASRQQLILDVNDAIRACADQDGVDLVSLDRAAIETGTAAWHNPGLFHRGKYEVSPAAAPMYGELVARVIAAQQGRSFKCLALDLDNTLWGGVIGDDGLQGIVLGQGSAQGEAFAAFQAYARDLGRRGIILAVCSKNDDANARAAFQSHPEMVLREADIACFKANWDDKATNLRAIAAELNIGLDAIVFVDDNPFERNLIRRELPMLAVPEIEADPVGFAPTLAAAGYFEGVAITGEDLARTQMYQAKSQREASLDAVTDMPAYLASLEMRMPWRRFDEVGRQRIVQLINKTNQFNLTTIRTTDEDVRQAIADPRCLGLQIRLVDKFGDHGVIAIVLGRLGDNRVMAIETWLMSCRVLGRQVEQATLQVIAEQAAAMGAVALAGEYRPTAKNGMVRDHYTRLGFDTTEDRDDGVRHYRLALPHAGGGTHITIEGS